MKRNIKFILYILFATSIVSCDYLDYNEASYYTADDVFDEFGRTKSLLTNVYSKLPHDFSSVDKAMRSCGTDEATYVNNLSSVVLFNDGTWSPIRTIDTKWNQMYSAIFNANFFLNGVKDKTWEDLRWNEDYEELMQQYELYPYEARVLRALFHFELMKRYGGIPIVTKALSAEEANNKERASVEEVVNFIVSECDEAIEKLPLTYQDFTAASETGRVTKGAAMALKAKTLLYAASPLHNPTGDKEKWKLAAKAAKDIIDLGIYSLESNYSNVVNKGDSKELIFGVIQGTSTAFEELNFPIGYEGGKSGTCPTQNLVNAYEMKKTGLPITDAESGYDPMSPYKGRDIRLGKSVIVNGSKWKGKTVELWHGGANAAPKANATPTGYYLKKYVIESVNITPKSPKRHIWALFRLGEVYLNYAEAMNEAFGPTNADEFGLTAQQAVNKVRKRVRMPEFAATLNQDEFRKKLRNERRVELAFEDHRFWDVRRWKIGTETTNIKGMSVAINPFGGYLYKQVDVETRVWDEKMNLFPIPQAEIYKNPKLKQNPNW